MQKLIEKFTRFYGSAPTVAAEAPGRLEILGNHTDYNQGFVLSCAVEQDTRFALRPVEGKHCRIKDFRDGSSREFDLDDIETAIPKDWSNYVKGVIVELRKRGIQVGAFDAGMESSVPLSAGMSSSAALETAAGFAFREAFSISLSPADWARVGQGVENNYMGLKSGLLDQFSSIFGKKNSMILSDFRSVEVLRTVPLPAGYSIVVINSMVKHNLVDSEYNVRRQDCESAAEKLSQIYPDVRTLRDVSLEQLSDAREALTGREFRRAFHVVGECTRVMEAVRLLHRRGALPRCLVCGNDTIAQGVICAAAQLGIRIPEELAIIGFDDLLYSQFFNPPLTTVRQPYGEFGRLAYEYVIRKLDEPDYFAQIEIKPTLIERSTT